jgi:transcriptional regulator with XRE-family HTH domain
MKLSDLRTAGEIHAESMRDPEYAAEYDRTRFANEVAVMVLRYRAEHGLSQSELARMLGMPQPNIRRLESGQHEPTVTMLAKLSAGLGLDFNVELRHGRTGIRTLASALQTGRGGRDRLHRNVQPGAGRRPEDLRLR